MYKCERCQRVMPAGTKAFRLAVEYRPRHYPTREKVNQFKRFGQKRVSHDQGGTGREIVREITVCPDCFVLALSTDKINEDS